MQMDAELDEHLAGSPSLFTPLEHDCGRGTASAKDAQGTLIQSHISPSILVCKENYIPPLRLRDDTEGVMQMDAELDEHLAGQASLFTQACSLQLLADA